MQSIRSLFLYLASASVALAAEFHVSTVGNDQAAGTKEAPFASILKAREAIRELKKAAPLQEAVTVWLHDGEYEITETVLLEAQDSGSKEAPITYRALPDANPRLIGARLVEGFTQHQGEILKADVSSLKVGKSQVRQLLFNGERQILARYPNVDPKDRLYGGWAYLPELPNPLPEDHVWKRNGYVRAEDVRKWAHPEEVEMDIFPMYGWWNFLMPVASLDPATKKLTLAKDCGYDLHPHNRFYFQNALEELDSPGEWYFDSRTQTLYFWPPVPLDKQEVRIPRLGNFFRLTAGTKHVTIRGLSFTGCVGNAIQLENTEECTIAACTLTTVGGFSGSAITIQGGKNNLATGNEISYTGYAGIGLGGGDKLTLTPANNKADNNHIHHVGVLAKNGAGVSLNGVGNIVSHNHIHHCPRMGIQFGGNNLVIEYNHIHHTVLETQDGGAVYTGGRDWISSRGTKLRYNFIHDTIGVGQGKDGLHWPHFTWGIYMDDNAGGLDIIGNVVLRSARASLHLHNGRDHLIENNIFAEGGERQIEFNGWTENNNFFPKHHPTMIAGWDSIQGQEAWKGMRNIELDPRKVVRPDGTIMSGNVFQRNIIYWTDATLRYLDLRNCSPAYNTSDKNLVWNDGHPVTTALSKVGPDKGEELLKHADLINGTTPDKTPKGWGWNHRPLPELQIVAREGGIVEVPAATGSDPKATKSVVHAPHLPFKAGTGFRARLKVRITGTEEPTIPLTFSFGVYANPGGYWATPNQNQTATPEWKEIEVTGMLPTTKDARYKSWMKTFWLRMDVNATKGAVQIKDLVIHEAETMNSWTSWQSEGWDKNSIIANPRFVSASGDDFRLNPDSPAGKIGFQPIPLEKIGLYPSELRAR